MMKRKKCRFRNKTFIGYFLLGLMGIFINIKAGNIMHLVGGTIQYEDGSFPINGHFQAYITLRPQSILTETSSGCGYGGGYYWVQCATFPEGWDAGEVLHIDFFDDYGYSVSGEVKLTYSAIDTLNILFLIPTYQVTIFTDPGGLECIINGIQYTTPYTFEDVSGTVSTISVPSPQSQGDPGIQYTFNSWDDNQPQTHSIKISSDTTFTAHFSTQYRVYTNQQPDSGGFVQLIPDKDWYSNGDQVAVKAIPDSIRRFYFWQWSGDLSGNKNPDTLTVDHVMYVVAHFKLPTYHVETEVQPEGYGVIYQFPDKETYEYRESVFLFADPVEGCRFDYWSGDLATAENPIEVIMDSSIYVVGYFKGTPTELNDPESRDIMVLDYRLKQNIPNPFNPYTNIIYHLPSHSNVRITVFNLKGEKIKELVNEDKFTGKYKVIWDATNGAGEKVSNGIYIYRIVADGETRNFTDMKKMLLLK